MVSGSLTVTGNHLGGPEDQIFVAFYRKGSMGQVMLILEATGVADQTSLTVTVAGDDALPAGVYNIILRVNGAQATYAPEVDWS